MPLVNISKFSRQKPTSLDDLKFSEEKKAIEVEAPKLKKITTPQLLNDYLSSVYNNVKKPGSFLGVEKLYDAVQNEGIYKITYNEIKKWLQKHEPYSLNRAVKRVKNRNRVIVTGIDDQFETDLADLSDELYVKANNGIKYLLVVIDVFSRFVWVRTLKDKKPESIISAFKNIFKISKRIPRRLRSDRGSEFTANAVQKFMKSKNIAQLFTANEVQANYAERVIKTLKSKIFRYVVNNNTFQYSKVLQQIVHSYNNTWHHGVRAKPSEVTKKNENRLWWQMYWPDTSYLKELKKSKTFRFEIGDKVRISLRRSAFQREYDQRWSGEIFIVAWRFMRERITPVYKLQDYESEDISGTFYENELQKVTVPNDELFQISKILERKRQGKTVLVKVSYKHWPSKFNRWIKESEIVNLK